LGNVEKLFFKEGVIRQRRKGGTNSGSIGGKLCFSKTRTLEKSRKRNQKVEELEEVQEKKSFITIVRDLLPKNRAIPIREKGLRSGDAGEKKRS